MNSCERSAQLASLLREQILPLIPGDYVLYGLPYYSNIGDTLIWEGALELLKRIRGRCRGVCAWNAYPERILPENTTILIMGGGYFGDLWRPAWESVLRQIRLNSHCRIVILPSSVWYQDTAVMQADAEILAAAPRLTVCARDKQSYDLVSENFRNPVLLVPDLAFAIVPERLARWEVPATEEILYIRRTDPEFIPESDVRVPANAVVADWPTVTHRGFPEKIVTRLARIPFLKDWAYYHIHRTRMTSRGVRFISRYRTVYSTRLHGMVLSALLGRDTYFLDNSYGKVGALYDTWLRDVDNVHRL